MLPASLWRIGVNMRSILWYLRFWYLTRAGGGWLCETSSSFWRIQDQTASRSSPNPRLTALEYSSEILLIVIIISYLCTYGLYGPVHNVFEACRFITWTSGRGLGPGEIETFLGPVKWHKAVRQVPFGENVDCELHKFYVQREDPRLIVKSFTSHPFNKLALKFGFRP